MENSVSKENPIVRAAIYLEYDGKCFYEGLPIRFQGMHIDHVIPEYLEGTKELKNILEELGLPDNFNINSLYNLVPCSPNCNQVKNKKQYPVEFLSHCIHMRIKTKVEKIKNRIIRLTKEYKSDRDLAKLIAKLNEYSDRKKLEELYNILSREQPFPIFREVNKSSDIYTYTRSCINVRLSGYIPSYPNLEGSCLITFSNLRLRDCMITLNHKKIMERLFSGANTKFDLKLREYIIYPCRKENQIYYADLGNVRIPLERQEVEQLTEIVDDFFNLYIKECKKLYFLFCQYKFSRCGKNNYLRLVKINKKLWSYILKFCEEFDYKKGNSEWNIFDSGNSFIKVYYKKEAEFKTFIFPEIEGSKFIIPNDESLWLVWTDEFFMEKKIEDLQSNKIWSPNHTYQWIINKLIPYVVYYYEEKAKGLFTKKTSYMHFKRKFNIRDFIDSTPYDIGDTVNFLHFIERMQLFYSTYKYDYYCSSDLINLYESLRIIFEKSDISLQGIEYIKGKLDINEVHNKIDISDKLNIKIKSINSGKIYSSFKIDNVFRCIIVLLRDYKNNLSENEINLLRRRLNVFDEKRIIYDIRKNF